MKQQTIAVQNMQDYIEEHLLEDISLVELAEVSMFSPWYAHRLFSDVVGVSPAEYIRKLRLTKAAKQLKDKKTKITDLAFEYGFGSVDGFTRAFTKEFGLTPSAYRLKPIPITLFIPYGVKFHEITKKENKMENIRNVFIQVVQKPNRKAIIKRGIKGDDYWSYSNEVGCGVWALLMSMDSLNGEPVCMWLPEKYIKQNTSKYVQGVEVSVDYDGEIPEGFDIIELPAAQYLMFQGEPFNEEDYVEAIQAVQQSMNKYDPSIIGYSWDDDNPRIQLEPKGSRGYIELIAIN